MPNCYYTFVNNCTVEYVQRDLNSKCRGTSAKKHWITARDLNVRQESLTWTYWTSKLSRI
jgi:hypothetical protein